MRYEEMYYYYKYYQNEYQNKLLSMKDDKIDNLTKKVEEQSQKIDKQSKDIEELLNYGKKTTEKLDDVQEDLNTMSEEFDNVNEQFDNLHEKVDDIKDAFEDTANRSVPNFKNNKKKGVFLLLQYKANINKYKFIRGMKQYTDKMLNSDYEDEYNLIEYDYNVNPIALFNKFKEIVKDELKEAKDAIKNNNKLKGNKIKLKKEAEKIKFANTNLELVNGFTQEDLSKKLKEIANLKFKEYEDATDDIP